MSRVDAADREPAATGDAADRDRAAHGRAADREPAATGGAADRERAATGGAADRDRAAHGDAADRKPAAHGDAADREPAAHGDAAGDAAHGGTADGDAAAGGAARRRSPWAGWDPIIRVAGLVVSILAAFLSGVFELLLTTLRAGDFGTVWRGAAIGSGRGPLVPVSILLAIVLNYAIAWFAVTTTRRRWALGPPWALWTLMMFAASGVRTSEGDYLLGGSNWVALVMILVGSLSFAVYSYRMILKRVRP
jgi:hypothetical protein